jgi:hypothetical protein
LAVARSLCTQFENLTDACRILGTTLGHLFTLPQPISPSSVVPP